MLKRRRALKEDATEHALLNLHKILGEGTYGTVHQCQVGEEEVWRSIKILNYEQGHFQEYMPPAIREILVGGVCSTERCAVVKFKENQTYGVIGFLGHCTLQEVASSFIPLHAARILGRLLLECLDTLHKKGIMHRDIKPDNIVLRFKQDSDWPELHLIDFGLSSPMHSSNDPGVVTLWWRPPEALLQLEHTQSLDIWSFGVIFCNWCSSSYLVSSRTEEDALNELWNVLGFPSQKEWPGPRPPYPGHKNQPTGLPLLPSHATDSVVEVLGACLRPNPMHRLCAADILNLSFWNEQPSSYTLQEATEWAKRIKTKYFCLPRKASLANFTKKEVEVFEDGTTKELLQVSSNKCQRHYDEINLLAQYFSWSAPVTQVCSTLFHLALTSSRSKDMDRRHLACGSAYIIICLYTDDEPQIGKIIDACSREQDDKEVLHSQIELAIHTLLYAMDFKLLPL